MTERHRENQSSMWALAAASVLVATSLTMALTRTEASGLRNEVRAMSAKQDQIIERMDKIREEIKALNIPEETKAKLLEQVKGR